MKQSEHELQAACVKWFDHQHGKRKDVFLFAVPNGGHRHPATARKLKAEGVRAGVPDLCLIYSRKVHGRDVMVQAARTAFIEMKTESGKLSAKQDEVCERLENMNVHTYVCRNLLQFIETINNLIG